MNYAAKLSSPNNTGIFENVKWELLSFFWRVLSHHETFHCIHQTVISLFPHPSHIRLACRGCGQLSAGAIYWVSPFSQGEIAFCSSRGLFLCRGLEGISTALERWSSRCLVELRGGLICSSLMVEAEGELEGFQLHN